MYHTRIRHLLVIAAALAVMLATETFAAITVTAGDWELPPDAQSEITIIVSGGTAVEGLNLAVQIGDGGTDVGGTDTAPAITSVDIVGTGLVFGPNNTGQDTSSTTLPNMIAYATTTTVSGTVEASGVLARVVIDTTGTTPGEQFPLLLAIPLFEATTDFAGLVATLNAGSILITPEPGSLTLVGVAGLVMFRRRRLGA